MADWFTKRTKSGSILISNWRQDWLAGQEVGNPLRGKKLCPLDKIARQLGYQPVPNLLENAKRMRVIYCGPARGFTDDHEGQRLRVAGHEVEVEIIE